MRLVESVLSDERDSSLSLLAKRDILAASSVVLLGTLVTILSTASVLIRLHS